MAKTDNMDMDIIVQASGIETTIAQFTQLTNTIANTTAQIAKLSTRVSTLMRGFSKLSQVNKKSDFSSRISSASSIVKSRNNRLNVGDLADWETGRVANTTYTFFNENSAKNIRNATREVSKTTKEVKKLDNSTKKATKSANNLYNRFKRFVSITAIVSRLEHVFNLVVKSSGEWIESLNLFSVTFGDNYEESLDWALEFADTLGVANQEIVKMTGLFKQLSTSIGLTDEMGDSLSQTLTQLGYDLGSFFNVDFKSTFERLQSGIFSGQIRTLRNFGIDISQESLDTLLETNEALRQFGVTSMQLSQSQKVLLRTIVVLQASYNAFGDLGRSIDTLQNRTRVLQASFSNLRLAIGDALSETVRDIVGNLNAVVQVMTSVIRLVIPIQEEVNYPLGDNIFTEISDDAEAANESIGLLSFDKFQVLSSGENENLSITEALTAELQKQQEIYDKINESLTRTDTEVQAIKDSILAWVFPNTTFEELQDRLEGVTDQGKRFDIILGELNPTLQAFINFGRNLITIGGEILKILANISPSVIKITSGILKAVSGIADLLDKLGLLEPILVFIISLKLASRINNLFTSVTRLGTSLVSGLGNGLRNVASAFTQSNGAIFKYGQSIQTVTNQTENLIKSTQRLNLANSKSVKSFSKASKSTQTHKISMEELGNVIGNVFSAITSVAFAVTSVISNWNNMSDTAKTLTIVVAVLTATVAMLAFAAYAATYQWDKAISVAAGVISTGAMVITAISGFENGGIPAKSELFYMNENGVPEALVNTGGTKTNVINIDQLSEGMRRGFVEAIYETGLNKNGNVTIKVDGNINNSAFARAIFPALKVESQRRGGNQL